MQPLPQLQRKTVTILFCDVIDSTPLGEKLDPEALQGVLSRYHDRMRTVLERHGGTVEKFIGDAVMAVFGIPTVHEDDALRSVRAAAEMREALADLNEELQRERGVGLAIRTGINTGEVVAGDPSAGHAFATGDAVVVAERLEQAARPGEILIGQATLDLVRNAVLVEPVDGLVLKGKAEGVSAWRLLGVLSGAAGFARQFGSPLVGRATELGQLTQAFERATRTASCHLFTILGPAGIGKSRLAGELLERVSDEAEILIGRCLPYGEGITFFPLAEMVRQAAGITSDLSRQEACARIARILEPEPDGERVAERLAAALGLTDAAAVREETFWAVRRLVENRAAERPVVVVFDDLHWAEATFLDLVEYLVGWVHDVPVLMLCLARSELLEERPSWGGGTLNATSVLLEPLTGDESELLMANLLGSTEISAETATRIARAAEGNPLFVEQMLAALGDVETMPDSVPPTIQALLAARLDHLQTEERTVIELASVAGRVFSQSALEELAPEPLRPKIGEQLLRLMRKELIRRARGSTQEQTFRFRHILIRDAAYAAVSKAVRADLHERFGTWLERTRGDRLAEYEEILGFHLEQAVRYRAELARADESSRALAGTAAERLTSAARRALGRGDIPAAVNLLSRAALLLESQEAPAPVALVELGSALRHAGEDARAEGVLSRAIDASRAAGDERLEAHARVVRERALLEIDPRHESATALAEAERAVAVFTDLGDELGLAKAWGVVGFVHWTRNRFGEAEKVHARALGHAERAGDAREAASLRLALAGALYFGPTPVDEAVARSHELLRAAGKDRSVEAASSTYIAGLEAMGGRFSEARDWASRSIAVYGELGLQVRQATARWFSGTVELLAGDPAAAERELRTGYEALASSGAKGTMAILATLLAEALLELGRPEEALLLSEEGESLSPSDDVFAQVGWRRTRALALAAAGSAETAIDLAGQAVELAALTDCPNLHASALADLAAVLLPAGASRAEQLLERAASLYEAKGNKISAARVRHALAAP